MQYRCTATPPDDACTTLASRKVGGYPLLYGIKNGIEKHRGTSENISLCSSVFSVVKSFSLFLRFAGDDFADRLDIGLRLAVVGQQAVDLLLHVRELRVAEALYHRRIVQRLEHGAKLA
jgi:hypothetical protein